MSQEEFLTKYKNSLSDLREKYPLESDILYKEQKKIFHDLLLEFNITSLSSKIEKEIDIENVNSKNENEEKYIEELKQFLTEEYKDIENNIKNNLYKTFDEYSEDILSWSESMKKKVPKGPNTEAHINEFILENILVNYEYLINNSLIDYNTEIESKKIEQEKIQEEIQNIRNEIQNINLNLKETELSIKDKESDKNYILKQKTSNADKMSKILKTKTDMINKLNNEIELKESKNNKIINELKDKIKTLEESANEKVKSANQTKTVFQQKKIELQTKIDLLENQIKNLSTTRTALVKSLTKDLIGSTQNMEIKKFEDQINNLNKKIEKLANKNEELNQELLEKDKLLESEKNKSLNIITDYENKIKNANEEHETIEQKAKEIQDSENENINEMKNSYETQIAEMKANFSKNEILIKSNIEKLSQTILKTTEEINGVKNEYDKSKQKFEEIKNQNSKDKVDYTKYVKILEENHNRIMKQYDECVKENNSLRMSHENNKLRLNGEVEKKLIAISKDNENIDNEFSRKKVEYEKFIKKLNDKLQSLNDIIPKLQNEENELTKAIQAKNQIKDEDLKQFELTLKDITNKHENELEQLKLQLNTDLENNKVSLKDNIDYAKKECEQQKDELLKKIKENAELNQKNQLELIDMFNEKIKILEQVKDEKIEDLNNDINEAKLNQQDYEEQTQEELQNTEEKINDLNNEMLNANNILANIQIEYNNMSKEQKEKYKNERSLLENQIEELLKQHNQIYINISLEQKENNILLNDLNKKNDIIDTLKNKIDDIKTERDKLKDDINNSINNLNKTLSLDQNKYVENLALKKQEIDYITDQINTKQKELEEFQKTFDDKIGQCKQELIDQYSDTLKELLSEKEELETSYNSKQSEYKDLEFNYNNQISLLLREKEVLDEKLKNVTVQIEELESNLKQEKENNINKIDLLKKENLDKNNQLAKENAALKQKLEQVLLDYNEMSEVYEKDKILWNNKYKHLSDDKTSVENELTTFKNKYNTNIDDLNVKLQNDRINLQQIYNDAIIKRDEKFNTQINNANKYFAQKFEYVNNLNQSLTVKNKELIDTLNSYETQFNSKDKEAKLAVTLQSIENIKKEMSDYNKNNAKNIDELQNKIITQRKKFTTKILDLQRKLRDYEMVRSSITASALKHNVNSEKDEDDQKVQITRLKNQISALEKANFRLQIDNRDAAKDNKNLRRKSKENSNSSATPFLPKARMTTVGKENNRGQINNAIPISDTSSNKKYNLIDKFNKQKFENDNDSIVYQNSNNSNNGSIILNNSYVDDKPE